METKKNYKHPEMESYDMKPRQILCDSVGESGEGARQYDVEYDN